MTHAYLFVHEVYSTKTEPLSYIRLGINEDNLLFWFHWFQARFVEIDIQKQLSFVDSYKQNKHLFSKVILKNEPGLWIGTSHSNFLIFDTNTWVCKPFDFVTLDWSVCAFSISHCALDFLVYVHFCMFVKRSPILLLIQFS